VHQDPPCTFLRKIEVLIRFQHEVFCILVLQRTKPDYSSNYLLQFQFPKNIVEVHRRMYALYICNTVLTRRVVGISVWQEHRENFQWAQSNEDGSWWDLMPVAQLSLVLWLSTSIDPRASRQLILTSFRYMKRA
jgi:hypothetical protein